MNQELTADLIRRAADSARVNASPMVDGSFYLVAQPGSFLDIVGKFYLRVDTAKHWNAIVTVWRFW